MMNYELPPAVRVFISSTFKDMQNERDYFNTVIAPELSRICALRGVSFFSVELRWGITQDEQSNGKVLPICFREIDKCRPFFIGIIGNRYGTILKEIPDELRSDFPWLANKEGCSITELEMLYAILNDEAVCKSMNCAVFFREDTLSKLFSEESGSSEEQAKLSELKKRISSHPCVPAYNYDSLERFGKILIQSFQEWIDRAFPSVEVTTLLRTNWYNGELLRNYVDSVPTRRFLNNYCESNRRSLMFYGSGLRGKTAFLTNFHPDNGHTVLVNCASDELFRYWPQIAHEIMLEINQIDTSCGFPDIPLQAIGATVMFQLMDGVSEMKETESDKENGVQKNRPVRYYVTDHELEIFRTAFVSWLQELNSKEDIYVIINDVERIYDRRGRFMTWLPVNLPEKLHVLCSTNADEILSNVSTLGWNVQEMPLVSENEALDLLTFYLKNYGKSISNNQKENLRKLHLLQYPGYMKFIANFLIVYGRNHNLRDLTSAIGEMDSMENVYRFSLNFMISEYSKTERAAVYVTLALLLYTTMGITENDCFTMVRQAYPIDSAMWSNIRIVLEQFNAIHVDNWNLENDDLKKIILDFPVDVPYVHTTLGRHFARLLQEKDNKSAFKTIRRSTEAAKAAIAHYCAARNWTALSEFLKRKDTLYYLTKLDWDNVRAAWMKLLLHSDENVPNLILSLIQDEYAHPSRIEHIIPKLSSLLIDLELLFTAQQAKNLTGIPVFSELRSAYFEREFTLQFADIHQKLSDLKKNHNYQSLRIKVSNILKEGHFTAYEQYALYEFKAESELQLSLLEDCLESSGHCYISAVQAMNIKAVLMALLLRAQCFNAMMRPKEAITLLKQAQSIAESIGDVRTYLSSLNTEGVCLYKEEKYEESISTFRTCISTWRQLGNVLEAETCHLNLCNALYLMGNVEEALKELRIIVSSLEEETTTHNVRQIYDIMYQNPGLGETYLTRLKIWVLGNLANCAAQKNLFSEAENAYLLSIQLSKGTVNEQALTKVYIGLINLYQANLMYMKAVEISEKLLEHFLKIGNPRAFKEYLEQEISLLIVSGNGETADYIRQKWNKQYENADVTKNIFYQNEMPGYSYFDELSESQFREKLSVIQNQGDLKNSAKLLSQYAEAHVASSPSVASKSYFEAAKCLYDNGDLAECKKNVCLGILCAFRAHESFDSGDELWLQACLDGQDNAVLSLWNQAYERKSEMAEDGYDKHFSELMFLVSSYAKNGVYLAQLCLTDFSESVFLACDLPLIMKLLDVLDGTELYNQFMTRIQTAFLSREESMVNFLRKDYFSQNAEKVLEQFEKGVQILIRLKNPNAAAVAGGIATIYRRREEWEKTLYYHQLSLDFYREKNLLNDVFIEITNLASAYDKMGDTDKAIGMLREALQKTAQRGLEHNHAAIAGNLAQLLSQQHAGTRYEKEILSCFAIEEQYFEASGEIRDLIISLLNQIEFYMQVPQKFEALILEKFHKADELILNHHLLEFYGKIRTLARFMPREYQKRPSSSNHRKKKPSSGLMNFFRKYFDRFSK